MTVLFLYDGDIFFVRHDHRTHPIQSPNLNVRVPLVSQYCDPGLISEVIVPLLRHCIPDRHALLIAQHHSVLSSHRDDICWQYAKFLFDVYFNVTGIVKPLQCVSYLECFFHL